MNRRRRIAHYAVTGLLAVGLSNGLLAVGRAPPPAIPSITPVPTTADSVPYGSDDPDVANLAAFGYVQEEFFISGTVDGLPYTTRVLVRRPADPSRFSAIVLAESIRSTAIRTMWGLRDYLMRRGHAYVGRWCADAGRPTHFKPSSPSPTDAVRDGSAKLGHPVQNVTREHGLTPLPR